MDAVSGKQYLGSDEEREYLFRDTKTTNGHLVRNLTATPMKQHIRLNRIWYILLVIVIITVLNSIGVLIQLTDTAPIDKNLDTNISSLKEQMTEALDKFNQTLDNEISKEGVHISEVSKSIATMNQSMNIEKLNVVNHFLIIEQEVKAVNKTIINNVSDMKKNITEMLQYIYQFNTTIEKAVTAFAEINKTMNTENLNVEKHFVDIEHEIQVININISDIKNITGLIEDISHINDTVERAVTEIAVVNETMNQENVNMNKYFADIKHEIISVNETVEFDVSKVKNSISGMIKDISHINDTVEKTITEIADVKKTMNQENVNVNTQFADIKHEIIAVNETVEVDVSNIKNSISGMIKGISQINDTVEKTVTEIADVNETMNLDTVNVNKHFADIEHEIQAININISNIKNITGLIEDISHINDTVERAVTEIADVNKTMNQENMSVNTQFADIKHEIIAVNETVEIDVNNIKNSISGMIKDISHINDTVEKTVTEIADVNKTMNQENGNVNKQFADIEHKIIAVNETVEVDVNNTKNSLSGMIKEISLMNEKVQSAVTEIASLQSNIDGLTTQLKSIDSKLSTDVGTINSAIQGLKQSFSDDDKNMNIAIKQIEANLQYLMNRNVASHFIFAITGPVGLTLLVMIL